MIKVEITTTQFDGTQTVETVDLQKLERRPLGRNGLVRIRPDFNFVTVISGADGDLTEPRLLTTEEGEKASKRSGPIVRLRPGNTAEVGRRIPPAAVMRIKVLG